MERRAPAIQAQHMHARHVYVCTGKAALLAASPPHLPSMRRPSVTRRLRILSHLLVLQIT